MEKSQVTLLDLPRTARTSIQRQVHLSEDKQRELVGRYREGALQRELAETYGINRRTVISIVQRHGARRHRGLNEAGIEEAVRRYESGQSLASIGHTLGVDQGTVRNRLLEQGIELRDSHGRER